MQNSRAKGEDFEHKICQILNKRFSTKGHKFEKNISNLAEGLKVCGDIAGPSSFRFSVDCKSGYDVITISDLFKAGSELSKFWKRCCARAAKLGLDPIMIWQHDNRDILAVIDINHIPASANPIVCYPTKVAVVNFRTTLKETSDVYWLSS